MVIEVKDIIETPNVNQDDFVLIVKDGKARKVKAEFAQFGSSIRTTVSTEPPSGVPFDGDEWIMYKD